MTRQQAEMLADEWAQWLDSDAERQEAETASTYEHNYADDWCHAGALADGLQVSLPSRVLAEIYQDCEPATADYLSHADGFKPDTTPIGRAYALEFRMLAGIGIMIQRDGRYYWSR